MTHDRSVARNIGRRGRSLVFPKRSNNECCTRIWELDFQVYDHLGTLHTAPYGSSSVFIFDMQRGCIRAQGCGFTFAIPGEAVRSRMQASFGIEIRQGDWGILKCRLPDISRSKSGAQDSHARLTGILHNDHNDQLVPWPRRDSRQRTASLNTLPRRISNLESGPHLTASCHWSQRTISRPRIHGKVLGIFMKRGISPSTSSTVRHVV